MASQWGLVHSRFEFPMVLPENGHMKTRGKSWHRLRTGAGLAALLLAAGSTCGQEDPMRRINPQMPPPMAVDVRRLEAAGVHRFESQHLALFTDVADRPFVADLPGVFDQAVGQWCRYFGVDPSRTEGWKIQAFLMADRGRFQAAGVLPDEVAKIPTGFNLGHHFWVVVQADDYYTRHLVLHEGTHAFMQWFLGGTGPAWYREGMAELLGLHRLDAQGKLDLEARIFDRTETLGWGRITAIQRAVAGGRAKSLGEVLDLGAFGFQDIDAYSWSWAACEFLARHPMSAGPFRNLQKECADPGAEFGVQLRRRLRARWDDLERDWRLYLDDMDYGVVAGDCRLVERESRGADDGWTAVEVAAAHGWQVTGFGIEPGQRVEIAAGGRFQVRQDNPPWPCEANGITIRYRNGRPLGMLLAGVVPDDIHGIPVRDVCAVGASGTCEFGTPGRLAFRINEGAAGVWDNQGSLQVRFRSGRGTR